MELYFNMELYMERRRILSYFNRYLILNSKYRIHHFVIASSIDQWIVI